MKYLKGLFCLVTLECFCLLLFMFLFIIERHDEQYPDCFRCLVFWRTSFFKKVQLPLSSWCKLVFLLQEVNGLLSNTFRKFSLVDRICQCVLITFSMLGNVSLKVSTNCKFPWVDGFSLIPSSIFRSTPKGSFKVMVKNFRLITPFDESIFKIL